MQISNTCGAPPYTLTISFQDRFSSLKASTSVSPTLGICNPNYIGSAMHHTLDREYSRSCKYLQLANERFKPSWHSATGRTMTTCIFGPPSQYTQTEQTIAVLKWPSFKSGNPDPFICQFFHPKKGILKKPALNTNAQFGLATLLRRAKHKFTPKLVRQILTSTRFQNRLELWTIIHALGSNTKARFEQTKMHGGRTLCYALRRLANNIQEPFRTLSLNAIDASIKWWHGKPCSMVPRPKSSTTIKEIPTTVASPNP